MRRIAEIFLLTTAFLSLAMISGPLVRAQQDPPLDAVRRVFSGAGAGFRAIRRGPDGSYYVLALQPSQGPRARPALQAPVVLALDAEGRKLRQIPAPPQRSKSRRPADRPRRKGAGAANSLDAHSFDVDSSGRVYIADLGGNTVSIYAADGSLFAQLRIPAPAQVVALPRDRFAVRSADSDRLIAVYDLSGKLLREFGELADLSDDVELNRRLNLGHLAADRAGNLYFAFRYLPEPTVRKYDSTSGYLLDELSLTSLDLQPMAQSARQEIARAADGKAIVPHEIISAFGLDPETQELWLALGNLLLRFNNADDNTGSNRAYTRDGDRMAPDFILVEKNRLLLGSDALGIYEFPRSAGGVHSSE